MQWPDKIFVSGIDTDAGKSYATAWLANKIGKETGSVITQKFIQTGNLGMSEDIEVHRRLMGCGMLPEDSEGLTAPQIFSYPASPHLAARIDRREVDIEAIDRAMEMLASRYSHVIVEGAGGLMVPVTEKYLTIDYIRHRKLPLVLVTNAKLGSISHTLLALNAVKTFEIPLLGVVYNPYFDQDPQIAPETRAYLRKWIALHWPGTAFWAMDENC